MFTSLPASPAAFEDADWDTIRLHYDRLASVVLDQEGVEAWLSEWSRLEELLGEASTLAGLAYYADTANSEREKLHLRWVSQIEPALEEQVTRLSRHLLESGCTRPDLEQVLARFRNQAELFKPENMRLEGELQTLKVRYQGATAGLTVDWDGERKTIQQLGIFALSADRSTRERSLMLAAGAYRSIRDELAEIFDQMVLKRTQVAANAGWPNYRDFAHRQKDRFDYSPADCLAWDQSVEIAVVPALARSRERRKRRLGVEQLRPWDLACDPDGRDPVRPYETEAELKDRAEAVFRQVSPWFGEQFAVMREEGLLDLINRPGKRPGAFCTSLPFRRRPYVFGNAVGTPGDVNMLLHEMGHAFHGFETLAHLPLVFQRSYGMEIAEVASMSMELLASPYLGRQSGGFYEDGDMRREAIAHLESIIAVLAHIASIDAFQQWVYTDGLGADWSARDAAWLEIRARFDPGVDWTGLEAERTMRWYQQQHIFSNPFYYIEYGLAQLGALQVWRNARRDQGEAVAAYRRALARGGTQPLPQLFAEAGARLIFDPEGMTELVAMVEAEIESLSANG